MGRGRARTAHADHGSLPRLRRRRTVDSPDAPPLSARHAALPYMGIKRTAPRDWSRPGTSRRPRPNAFQAANGISSRRRRYVLPLRPPPIHPRYPVPRQPSLWRRRRRRCIRCNDVSSRRDTSGARAFRTPCTVNTRARVIMATPAPSPAVGR